MHGGDLESWARELDALRHDVRAKVLLPLPWSPLQQVELASVPTDAAELSRKSRDGDGRFTTHARRVPSKPAVSTHELHGRD